MKKIKLGQFLLVDKPKGWTSFDAVARIRREASKQLGEKKVKVGHAGTLDPFATGLLIIGVGREATKRIDEFKQQKKVYLAEIELGAVSDSYDSEGEITRFEVKDIPSKAEIKQVLNSFLGKIRQIPPMYSAKKVAGKRLYELARQGKEVERQPAKVEIYKIKLKNYSFPVLKIKVVCSSGTYIRSLAYDIGQKLGVGAYCRELRRLKIGKYSVRIAIKLK